VHNNPIQFFSSLSFAQKASILAITATLLSLVVPLPKPILEIYLLSAVAFVILGLPLFIFVWKRALVYVVFISIFLLCLGYAGIQSIPRRYPYGRSVKTTIKLISYPSVQGRGLRFTARLLGVEGGEGVNGPQTGFEGALGGKGKVLFSMPFPRELVSRGDTIKTEGVFFPLPFERSPGYANYLRSMGMTAVLEGYRGKVDLLRRPVRLSPVYLAVRVHRYVERVHKRLMLPAQGAFATALLTGSRENIPAYLTESFRDSGTMHILAVSGLHVGFLCLFMLFILRLIRVPKMFAYGLLALFVLFFMIFIGEKPSVRRASFMALCGIGCFLLDRDRDYLNVLALAFIILWITNPLSLLNPGFLLSFCATFGILFLMPVLYNQLARILPGFVAGSLAVTLSVQLFIFPVMASFFGSFAWINVVANLPIVPLAGVSLGLGVLTLLLYHLFLPLAVITAEVNTVVITSIARLADLFSRIPPLRIASFPPWLIPVYLLSVTVLLSLLIQRLQGTRVPGEIPVHDRT
jgi:ComEC/Rec2-related protein